MTALLATLLLLASPAFPTEGPPREKGPFRAPDLVELQTLDPTIKLEIRYATSNNFVGRPVYDVARAFLQRPAAEALLRAHRAIAEKGYGLLIFDAYRPWRVTKMFWDITPPAQREFVANPKKGSKHNRGCAVDLSLYELATGKEVPMPSPYDDFTPKAYPNYPGGTAEERAARAVLRQAMEREGFKIEPNEWWHFNYREWMLYPILDVPFDAIHPSSVRPVASPAPSGGPEAPEAALEATAALRSTRGWPRRS